MITVQLLGGLGNQMFQYAAGKRLADKLGVPLRLDVGAYAAEQAEVTRHYELGAFPIEASLTSSHTLISRLLGRVLGTPWPGFTRVSERTFRFDSSVLEAADNSCLVGYFQSEKYFADAAPAIRRSFAFQSGNPASAELEARIDSTDAVAVHVRRGDYLTGPGASQVHGVLPLSYYQAACERMTQHCPSPQFYLFSDDIEWCKLNLAELGSRVTCVDLGANSSPIEDLRLMARCRHHVIANSSFSWWGAWLNPRADKIVVAPHAWFRDSAIDTSDLLPESWIRL